jgi:DNA-binding CsgD family transcriptional regulator
MNPSSLLYSQRRLKAQTLDHWSGGNDFFRATCAEMILSLDDPAACWQQLVDALRVFADCDRVDAGPCARFNESYSPIAQASRNSVDVSNVVGLSLPNLNPSVQWLWTHHTPYVSDDISQDSRLDSTLVSLLRLSGTHGFLSLAIKHEDRDVGLICLDHIDRRRSWGQCSAADICEFVASKAAPILAAAGSLYGNPIAAPLDKLTPSELAVARLAAQAASYKSIARTLGKSFSTVDHQLRSIRSKLGVKSHTELVRLLQVANLRDWH